MGDIFYIAYIIIVVVCMIVALTLESYYSTKCPNVSKCSNSACKMHKYCEKYKRTITKEEIQELLLLLENFN